MTNPKLWCDKDEALSNCYDAVAKEMERVHPADRPDMAADLGDLYSGLAKNLEKLNEDEGVPER